MQGPTVAAGPFHSILLIHGQDSRESNNKNNYNKTTTTTGRRATNNKLVSLFSFQDDWDGTVEDS